jgi:uncharacterized protein YqgC (DUF456 family)
MMPEWFWIILGSVLMLVGLVDVVVPALPDLLLIWGTALGYGLLVGWGDWGPWLFAGITVLCGVGLFAEVWTSGAGARIGGASAWSIVGGVVAGVILLLVVGPLGGVIALLAGIFLLEWRRHRDSRQAGRAVLGTAVGYGASFFVKFGLALSSVGLWIIWVITN